MKVSKLSLLARSIDLSYPTNRAIVIITLIFFLGASSLQFILERDVFSALYSGLKAGASVFLAWAFARELDPDNELSAFFAAFLGCMGFLLFPSPFLLALLLGLLQIRILNRSIGLPSKISDSLAVLLLSGWISLQEDWIFGLLTALAFFLDSFLPKPNRQNLIFGVASFIVAVLAFLRDAGRESMILNTALGLFMLATALLFIPRILSSRKIESKGDLTGVHFGPSARAACTACSVIERNYICSSERMGRN